ncbi:MAG: hypothetical protein ACPGU1_09110 [Myxococcota bacterium]
MMNGDGTQLNREQASRALAQVLPRAEGQAALVMLPSWMCATAESLSAAMTALGYQVTLALQPEPDPVTMSVSDCADRWVPSGSRTETLMVLCGVRPWAESVAGDHLIEIEAMTRREALLAAGQRLLFIDWPRGARKDAEIDLRPDAMRAIYSRAFDIDYDVMRRWNEALLARVAGAEEVRIRCPAGTDLRLSVAGRRWLPEDCILGDKEPAVYLPGGEIYTAAREDSAMGQVVFHHVGEQRVARFAQGQLLSVEYADGTPDDALAEEMGVGHEPLCELGIGTNPWAPPWQIGTLYEKSAGTVHVAVGGNAHFGGERDSPRHMDLIIRAPELTINGESIPLPPALWQTKES